MKTYYEQYFKIHANPIKIWYSTNIGLGNGYIPKLLKRQRKVQLENVRYLTKL